MTIKFDAEKAVKAFESHLVKTVRAIQMELLHDAQAGMTTPEGRQDLFAEGIQAAAGIITAQITGGPWAIVDEYGKGSLMDPNNPALDEYRNSPFWNPVRKDLVIRGRPAGPYTNIFGERRVSSGRAKGVNLERLAVAGKIKDDVDDFLPKYPSHAVKIAFRWMRLESFQRHLNMAIRSFPWARYLKVTNTKR
ncbi:MAG: hypothetical protein HPY66_1650 [Firmicutes bacterium]|nr:hypothetical protein [Bacillota bacterium]